MILGSRQRPRGSSRVQDSALLCHWPRWLIPWIRSKCQWKRCNCLRGSTKDTTYPIDVAMQRLRYRLTPGDNMNTTPVIQRSCPLYCKLEAGSLLRRMTLQGCSFQHVEPEAVWRSFPVTGEDAFLLGRGPSSSAIGDLCEDKIVKSSYCFSLVLQGAPPDVWLCDSRFWRQMLPMLDPV